MSPCATARSSTVTVRELASRSLVICASISSSVTSIGAFSTWIPLYSPSVYSRFYSYSCSKYERFAALDLNNVDLRMGNDLLAALFYCIRICRRKHCIDCIVVEYFFSIHFLDKLTRSFSFTESRNVNAFFHFIVSTLDCFLIRSLPVLLRSVSPCFSLIFQPVHSFLCYILLVFLDQYTLIHILIDILRV